MHVLRTMEQLRGKMSHQDVPLCTSAFSQGEHWLH